MRKNRFYPYPVARKGMPFILAVCWISGVVCGVFCYWASSPEIISLMRRTPVCSVSIVGLLNAALMPFLLSAFIMVFSVPWMILGISFVKAFLFSFASMEILVNFGSGGWLLRYFLLFSDCAALPLLYWYWLRSVSMTRNLRWLVDTCIVLVALVMITVLDYRVIAPIVCLIDSMKG
ncbi:MAG: hypothetical protein Q4F81_05400 [Eubacteriales bacterium]|nr:hypothetical protein [Eubacteriales bacterium]